jgi:hypothetical protein
VIASRRATHFPSSQTALIKERKIKVMRSLKKIIFVFAMAICLALSVSAQTDDQKRPPKGDPPVRNPKPKPPRDPKGDDKPKKPGMSFYLVSVNRDANVG